MDKPGVTSQTHKISRTIETEFGRILEESLNEIYVFDANTLKFLQVNSGARENLGYTIDELRELTPLDLKPEYTLDSFSKLLAPLRSGKERIVRFETKHRRKDRSMYDVEAHLQLSSYQKRPAFVAIILDITSRKRTEDALRQSEERFRELAENIDEIFWLTDSDKHTMLYISPAYERIFGRSCTSLYQSPKSFLDAVHPDDLERVVESLPHQREGNYRIEFRIIRPDNELRFLRTRAFPVLSDTGNVYRIAGITEDITDRIKAEAALHDSKERLQAVVNTAADAIITIDRNGLIMSFNFAAERIFGYESGEAIGKNVNILMPSPYREQHDGYIARYLKTGKAKIIGNGREVVAQRKDGTTFPIDLAVSEVDHLAMFTGVIRDLTDRKKAEHELEQARNDLTAQTLFTQRLSALATMAGGIAHELNQPLSGIRLYAETIQNVIQSRETVDTSRIITTLKKVIGQVDRASKIIDHMREFASDKKKALNAKVEAHSVVNSVLELIGQQLHNHNIQFVNDVEPGLKIRVDQTQLEQVLIILISNAKDSIDKAVYAQECTGKISVSSAVEHDSVVLRIHDNGGGVRDEVRHNLFEPFVTTKTPDCGMGLGLSICHGILKDYRASISLERTGADGTTFLLKFPKV